MLSTDDNPHSPFTEYDEWYQWDVQHGYNTCSLLDTVSPIEGEIDTGSIEQGMNDIVRHNVSGRHVIVLRSDFDPPA